MKQKDYRTRRLTLCAPRASHFAAWLRSVKACGEKRDRYDAAPLKASLRTKRFFLAKNRRFRRQAKEDKFYLWRVFLRSSPELVGYVELDVQVRDNVQCCYIGYRILNHHWGKGYGREACARLLRAAFGDFYFHRVEAVIDPGNRRSCKVAADIGMRREGIRKRYYFQDGAYADQVIYVANPEYLGLRPQQPRV